MRTIKEGVPSKQGLFYGVCNHCGWEAEAKEAELQYINGFWCCRCPTEGCGKVVDFVRKPEKYIDRSAEKYGGGQ